MCRKVLLLFFMLFLLLFSHAHAAYVDYQSDSGTYPDSQGWNLYNTIGNPPYTLVGNDLHQGLTSTAGYQYWYRNDLPLDFTSGAAVFEWSLDIIQAYRTRADRGGFNVQAQDYQGHLFNVWIHETEILLDNNSVDIGYAFDTTGFHTYRFEVSGSSGSLYIDGSSTAAIVIPVGAVTATNYNRILFGDGSYLARNESLLDYFYADNEGPEPVPEPSTLILFGTSLVGMACFRRKLKTRKSVRGKRLD